MILLDTHTWLWWIEGSVDLPAVLRQTIESHPEPVFELAIEGAGLTLLPLTPAIAERSAFLPEIHRDPIDRIIVATAMCHEAQLLSRDALIAQYPGVLVSWGR